MSFWKRNRAQREQAYNKIATARQALAVTINERAAAKSRREEAAVTADEFAARAITLREVRLRNHITPSLFPPQEGRP